MDDGNAVGKFGTITNRPIVCEWSNIVFVGRFGNCLIDRRTPLLLFYFTTSAGYLYSLHQYASTPNWQWPVGQTSPYTLSSMHTIRALSLCSSSSATAQQVNTSDRILFCGYIVMIGVKAGFGYLLQVSSQGRAEPEIPLLWSGFSPGTSPGVDYYSNSVYVPYLRRGVLGIAQFTNGRDASALVASPQSFVALPESVEEVYSPVVCGSGSGGVVFVGSPAGYVFAIRSNLDKHTLQWTSHLIWQSEVSVSAAIPTCSADYVYFSGAAGGFYSFRIGYYDSAGWLSVTSAFAALIFGLVL